MGDSPNLVALIPTPVSTAICKQLAAITVLDEISLKIASRKTG
jgi:hypothetical protein